MRAAEASQRYDVLDTLARGGMAEVLLARQRVGGVTERYVVLKATLPHLAHEREFVASFLDEVRLAAQLSHPNIAQIHDVARLGDRPCIVMEWLRGRDLRRILHRLASAEVPMELPVATAVVRGAAAALSYAHRAVDARGNPLGIVHRDVSPHNVFLTREGGVKLIDFGVARSVHQVSRTEAGTFKGKIAYMAPELIAGRGVDARSDLWSLGVVAWECVTGERLFRGSDQLATMQAVSEDPIRAPSELRPAVDPALDDILRSLLEREPERRIQTALELEQRLDAWGRRHHLATTTELAEWIEALFPRAEEPALPDRADTASIELSAFPETDGDATVIERGDTVIDLERPAPRSRGRATATWIGAAAAVIVLAGITAVLLGRGASPTDPVEAAAPAPTSPAAPAERSEAEQAPPARVTLRVENLPEGARLWVDGRLAEGDEAALPRGDAEHAVAVRDSTGRLLYEGTVRARSDLVISLPEIRDEPRPTKQVRRRPGAPRREGLGMMIDWSYE